MKISGHIQKAHHMWKCPKCKEVCEDNFDSCWNCSTARDHLPTADQDAPAIIATGLSGDREPTELPLAAPENVQRVASEIRCQKCGSNRIVLDAVLCDQGESSDGKARMEVYEHPSAWIFKGATTVQVRGNICCDCGNLELKCVGDLQAIWNTSLQARRN